MPGCSRRDFLSWTLALGGVSWCASVARADLPRKPPPTLEYQVRHSPIIALCEVERVGYVYDQVRGGPASFSETKPFRWVDLRVVLEVRVIEWLRVPASYQTRPLRVFGGSAYKFAEYQQYVGKEFVFFLQRDFRDDRRPGDREDYFSGALTTFMHGPDSPTSVDRLPEVRRLLQAFPEARPYGQ